MKANNKKRAILLKYETAGNVAFLDARKFERFLKRLSEYDISVSIKKSARFK